MPPTQPFITLIVATRNCGKTLPRCLDSIREQTFPACEVIVIDADSSDNTLSVIKRNSDIIAHWVSEPDSGIYDAWNKALPHARGEWVLFLGADDYLSAPDVLAQAGKSLATAYPAYCLAYGKVVLLDGEGRANRVVGEPWYRTKDKMRRFMALPHQGVFHHRTLFVGAEPFDTSFSISGDYDFLLGEVFEQSPLFLDITVSYMGFGGVSTTSGNGLRHLMERARAQRRRGIALMSPLFLRQLLGEVLFFLLSAVLPQRASRAIRGTYRRILKRPV